MFSKRASFLLLSVLTILVGHGLAQNYGPQVSYQSGTFPIGIAQGDFNHDGNLDVVVANFSSASLSIFLGRGDGTFAPATTVPVGQHPISIAVADFDGDGNLDVAVALEDPQVFQLLFGNGDGTFRTPVSVPIPSGGNGFIGFIVAADFNEDGHPDLALSGTGGLQIFLNNGAGGFSPGALIHGFASHIAVADFNKDGHQDLAYFLIESAACGAEGLAFLSLGNGDGTFQPAVQLPVTLSDPSGIAVADLNKDGRLDLVVSDAGIGSCPNGSVTNGSVQVLLQQPDGTFLPATTIASTVHPGSVAVGDFDGDGKPDIAVLQSDNASVTPVPPDAVMIYLGDGSGNFSGPHQFNVGGGPAELVAASFANTLALDIAVSDAGTDSISVLVNQGANTVTLSSSSNPPTIFSPITLTATVEPRFPGSGSLSGSMTFTDAGKTLGSGSVDSAGVASVKVTFTTAGAHSLEAVFSGNASFVGGSSAKLNLDVDRVVPPITLASSPNPSVFGQPVHFSVTVLPVASGVTPTGSVDLVIGDPAIGVGPLDSSGKAAISVASLPAGTSGITAVYSGDANYASTNSAPLVQAVNKSATATALAGTPNPSVFGQVLTLTATVIPTGGGAGVPTGMVTFSDSVKSLGSAALDPTGKASLAISSLDAGKHAITASYAGDSSFSGSTSTVTPQTVNKSATNTILSTTPDPSVFGQAVTLNVTVTASGGGAGVPPGVVTLLDGGTSIGTVTLDNAGKGTLAVNSLSVANHSLTASYVGDTNFLASATADGITQIVHPSSTIIALVSSANPAVFGQSVTFTASVSASGGGSGVPPGNVIFSDGTTTLATVAVDNTGKATVILSSQTVGVHNIAANYAGTHNYLPSSSNPLAQTINENSVVTTLTSGHDPATFGQAITFTVQTAAAPPGGSPGTPIPTGTVTFSDGNTALATARLDNTAKAAFTTDKLSVGLHTITAAYSGDGNFVTGASTPITETVDKAPSQTLLASSLNPATNASSFTLTATVAATPGTASGTIVFLDGATQLASVPLDSQAGAVLSLSNLPVGLHGFAAVYSGDGSFMTSQSALLKENVVDSHSAVAMTSSVNPQIVTEAVTLVATITTALGGTATSGSVTFTSGAQVLGKAPVNNSTASFTTSSLPVGTNPIVATYRATALPGPFDGVSATLEETINLADGGIIIGGKSQDFAIAIAQSTGQITAGQSFTTSITLTPLNGLTGPVSTLCAGVPTGGNCSIDTGSARFDGKTPISAKLTITTTAAPSGTHAAAWRQTPCGRENPTLWATILAVPLGFCLVALPLARRRTRRVIFVGAVVCGLTACGGTHFMTKPLVSDTPPGSYTVTVQSQSGTLVHSGQIALTIQ